MNTMRFNFSKIREKRREMNLKQSDIAKVLGISTSSLSNYENGITDMPISHLVKLASFFESNVSDFIIYNIGGKNYAK